MTTIKIFICFILQHLHEIRISQLLEVLRLFKHLLNEEIKLVLKNIDFQIYEDVLDFSFIEISCIILIKQPHMLQNVILFILKQFYQISCYFNLFTWAKYLKLANQIYYWLKEPCFHNLCHLLLILFCIFHILFN